MVTQWVTRWNPAREPRTRRLILPVFQIAVGPDGDCDHLHLRTPSRETGQRFATGDSALYPEHSLVTRWSRGGHAVVTRCSRGALSLILSHHFRFNITCECYEEERNDDDAPAPADRLDPMETTTTFIFGHPPRKADHSLVTRWSRDGHAVGHAVEPCTQTPNPQTNYAIFQVTVGPDGNDDHLHLRAPPREADEGPLLDPLLLEERLQVRPPSSSLSL